MLQLNRRQVLAAGGTLGAMSAMSPIVKASTGSAAVKADLDSLPRVKQELVAPPFAPAHEQVASEGPKIIEVELVVHEEKREIDDDGTVLNALSFNGSIPGPLMVCHEGDYIELTLKNPSSNVMEHNIDFHASTGALGGGGLTLVQPGEQVVLRWKAIKAGTFIYHCAPGGIMIPYHVVSGMNGAVMVLPRGGLTDRQGNPVRYDKVYYVGEQDFYVPRNADGDYMQYESHSDAMADVLDVMRTLTPTHVVMNGKVGALTGDNALTSKLSANPCSSSTRRRTAIRARTSSAATATMSGRKARSSIHRWKASRPGSSGAARRVLRSTPSGSRACMCTSRTTSSRPCSWGRSPMSWSMATGTTT